MAPVSHTPPPLCVHVEQSKQTICGLAGTRTPKPLLPQQQCFRNFLLNATALAMNSSSHLDHMPAHPCDPFNAHQSSNI
jgi:hypothetical protein